MFIPFLYHLRAHGLSVTSTEWLTLMEALKRGFTGASLAGFYRVGRAILVHSESDFDRWDRAFASFFEGVEHEDELPEELLEWLAQPLELDALTPEQRAAFEAWQRDPWSLDRLRKEFEDRLNEQEERHDGGDRWIGTGGTSPFGHGGANPQGVRVGGSGGGRSAVQIAQARRYRNLRNDRVLDTRQIGSALRRLRRLNRQGSEEVLDLDGTIDKSARGGGEIELVFGPPRENRVKLLLLMDVGGSMDPHAQLCERLFSAAHALSHFKAFEHYFFHNCIYDELFTDFEQQKSSPTADVLKKLDASWSVVLVGDAWMHPFELDQVGGIIDFRTRNEKTGYWWLTQLRQRCPRSVWLNPEPERIWGAPSIHRIRGVFPMFPLTLDGIRDAVDGLRGAKRLKPIAS